MADSVTSTLQQIDLPAVVELFSITYDGSTYYLTNTFRQTEIWWNEHKYTPFPLTVSGFGYTNDNMSEVPEIMLSNVGAALTAIIGSVPDLKGSTLVYVRTFETYISSSSAANSGAFISKYNTKFAKLKEKIEDHIIYELDTLLMFKNRKFPPRQILREGLLNFRFEGAGLYRTR